MAENALGRLPLGKTFPCNWGEGCWRLVEAHSSHSGAWWRERRWSDLALRGGDDRSRAPRQDRGQQVSSSAWREAAVEEEGSPAELVFYPPFEAVGAIRFVIRATDQKILISADFLSLYSILSSPPVYAQAFSVILSHSQQITAKFGGQQWIFCCKP